MHTTAMRTSLRRREVTENSKHKLESRPGRQPRNPSNPPPSSCPDAIHPPHVNHEHAASRRCSPLLTLPAQVFNEILRLVLSPQCDVTTVDHRNEKHCQALLSIPHLLRQVLNAVHTVRVDWGSIMEPWAVASMERLQTLVINRHTLASVYLFEIKGPLRVLKLEQVILPDQTWREVVRRIAPTLRDLSLHFVTCSMQPFLDTHCQLSKLSLAGVVSVNHDVLASLLNPTLVSLSLHYLRDPSINDHTLTLIAGCRQLHHLEVSRLRKFSSDALQSLLVQLPLRWLSLHDSGISAQSMVCVLAALATLENLSFGNVAWSATNTAALLAGIHCNSLKEFHLTTTPGITDDDVRMIVERLPDLESLGLLRHPAVTDAAIHHIANLPQLGSLILRGIFLTDDGLRTLASAKLPLTKLALGGDEEILSNEVAASIGGISNTGLNALLQSCPMLECFLWESPQTLDERGARSVGVSSLDPKLLAQSLAKFCKKLRRVEVNWLMPSLELRRERARCMQQFMDLHRKTGADIFLDQEPAGFVVEAKTD